MSSSPEKTVRERVAEVLSYHLLVDETEITPGANLREDLCADSLDMIVQLVVVDVLLQQFGRHLARLCHLARLELTVEDRLLVAVIKAINGIA